MTGPTTRAFVELTGACVRDHEGRVLVADADVRARAHRVHAIVGPTGSGKSQLLNQLRDVSGDLVPNDDDAWAALVHRTLDVSGLLARPDVTLSHGERELCRVARASLPRGALLALDGPVGIDESAATAVGRLLHAAAARGSAVVVATADLRWACRWAHLVGVIRSGRLHWDHPDDAIARHGAGTRRHASDPSRCAIRPGPTRPASLGAHHAARLTSVVRGRLGLRQDERVVFEAVPADVSPTGEALTVVRALDPTPLTWFVQRALPDLSPHELTTVIATDPEGHTNAF